MEPNKSYEDHFDQRGSAYDLAMRRFPHARKEEFAQVIGAARLQPGMRVADVPAGGGYLQAYLPAGCEWLGHEPCPSFTNHGTDAPTGLPLLPLSWDDASVDAAISLAGIHHIAYKRPFFAELFRVTKPGGTLVVSDVAAGSAVARFLDGYVGAHNSTGHDGLFLDEGTLEGLRSAGWSIEHSGVRDFEWVFANRADMASFCHALFDLRTSSEADTLAAIETQLGVTERPDGAVGMKWSLLTIRAAKRESGMQ